MASDKHTTPAIQLDFSFTEPEIWRPVPAYEGLYEVSSLGRVRSLDRYAQVQKRWRHTKGRILIPGNSFGYERVTLAVASVERKNQRFMVHVLVLSAFVGPRPEGYDANHIDGNKSNNVLDNLEWVTRSENILHAFATGLSGRDENHCHAKLTVKQVQEIRALYAQGGTLRGMARTFGVTPTNILHIVRRRNWKHIP